VREDTGEHLEEPVRLDLFLFPSERERPEWLGSDGVTREAVGRVAEQDLARAGDALEPLRDVDCVPGGERVATDRVTGDHLPAVHTYADGDLDAVDRFEILVEDGDRVAQLGGRTKRSQGVVLVQHRRPEHGHDRVAHELLHGAAVALEDVPRHLVVAGEDAPDLLRVLALAE